MNRPLALVLCVLTLLAASALARRAPAQDSPGTSSDQPGLLPADQPVSGPACAHCSPPQRAAGLRSGRSSASAAHGFSILGGRYCQHGAGCNRCAAGHGSLAGAIATGQPLVDPWARADWIAANRAATQSWHAGYYHTQWGAPLALLVPPTARMQTRYSWGVAQNGISPIYHQYERPYPGAVVGPDGSSVVGGAAAAPLQPTPRWPSHTDQFGVYYVRGPW